MIKLLIILGCLAISIHTNQLETYSSEPYFLSQIDLDNQMMLDSHLIPCEFLIDNYWFDIKPLQNQA